MAYRVVLIVYGLVLIAGGFIGFAMAGSMMSLVVGGLSGLAMVAFGIMAGSKPGLAFRSAAVLSLGLAGFWVYRISELSSGGRPVGMAVGNLALALIVLGVLGAGHLLAMRNRSADHSGS